MDLSNTKYLYLVRCEVTGPCRTTYSNDKIFESLGDAMARVSKLSCINNEMLCSHGYKMACHGTSDVASLEYEDVRSMTAISDTFKSCDEYVNRKYIVEKIQLIQSDASAGEYNTNEASVDTVFYRLLTGVNVIKATIDNIRAGSIEYTSPIDVFIYRFDGAVIVKACLARMPVILVRFNEANFKPVLSAAISVGRAAINCKATCFNKIKDCSAQLLVNGDTLNIDITLREMGNSSIHLNVSRPIGPPSK